MQRIRKTSVCQNFPQVRTNEKKSVSTVYGVLLVIGFILMALSFAFAGKKEYKLFAEDSRRIELQPDRVVEVGEDVREYYFDSNQMQSEFFGTDIF